MSFTDFYCDPVNGSNLNGGSDSGSPSMSDTAGTGSWTSSTNVYISVATNGSVTVGQFMSLYQSGATIPAYVARITAVTGGGGSAWTITLSSTAISGAKPTTGSTFLAQVGGTWQGPTGSIAWPFGGATTGILSTLTNSSSNLPRVNLLNTALYSISSGITHSNGSCTFQGYASTVGDGGKWCLDAGGNAIIPMTLSGQRCTFADFIIQNNGSSGTNAGLFINTTRVNILRGIVRGIRGVGVSSNGSSTVVTEVEAYACNIANTTGSAGVLDNSAGSIYVRCFSHDNAGNKNNGFAIVAAGAQFIDCVSANNGNCGFYNPNNTSMTCLNCDAYNNGSDGFLENSSSCSHYENCNAVANQGYGFNFVGAALPILINCGVGTGSAANVSGKSNIPATCGVIGIGGTGGIISYSSGAQPWSAPVNGNFNISLAAAENTGRGNFTQTGYLSGSVTAASNAAPIVITSNGHGLNVGDMVVVAAVSGNTAANGTWPVSAVTTNTFTLSGSSGNGAYTSGGTWNRFGTNSSWSNATTLGYPDIGAAPYLPAAGGAGGTPILQSGIIQGLGAI